ncbi:unnamed protein product [Kuraishia capsulata CBS 1993]|uniref:Major facilitator superfamily (MFS) profile domain-containing protein n=1 Tax=Kuraishia capsulata CBS 1993 TaxID=1382522 RepID=W6MGS1_9ASCO|nr:uncharacterized protein KUCA_T00001008001 [Kuraishia capsulata CBS 1993]CDK25041.1 unnamed protein product [Kuraishia capsulata CBS 1993]
MEQKTPKEDQNGAENLEFSPVLEASWAKYVPGPSINRLLKFEGRKMINCILALSGSFIIFFGYDASVMSQVNDNVDYERLMGVNNGTDRDSAAKGGIVSIWFLGFGLGAIMVGSYADRIGRLRTAFLGCLWALLGAALQCSAQNITWMMFSRIINGIGCGHLNTVVPLWTSEIAEPRMRGMFVATQFTLALAGSTIVYWMEYGLSIHESAPLAWRFPIGFQMLFLFINMCAIPFFPESPRYLFSVGKVEEAKLVLERCRLDPSPEAIDEEMSAILMDLNLEVGHAVGWKTLLMPFFGQKDPMHNLRRVVLGAGVQVMQKLTGIDFIATYAPQMFQLSGFSANRSTLLAGGNFFVYWLSLATAIYTIDNVGRRKLMLSGLVSMFVVLFIGGGLAYKIRADPDASNITAMGNGICAVLYLYTFAYGSTWLTVCWLYPSEIFSLQTRSKGAAIAVIAFSLTGGAINEIVPYLIKAVHYWVFFIFGFLNLGMIVPVYLFYLETSRRTLEDLDILFMSSSPFVWRAERDYEKNKEDIQDRGLHQSDTKEELEYIEEDT